MADITFTSDGADGLRCSVCGDGTGFTIDDAVMHADWCEARDAKAWRQGWLARGAELAAIATLDKNDFTATERQGVMKAYQRQVAAIEGGAQ